MLQPVGPLPASVYWRRRAVAAALVLLVLVLFWIALPGGGGESRPTAGAAGSATPAGGGAPTSLAATPPADDPGRPGTGGGSAATVPAGTAPAGTTAAPTAAPRTSPPPPRACRDKDLALRVVPERPAYAVGQSPVLDLQVRNISTTPCVRDLGAAQQEILLYRGDRRLWSSNDCYPDGERRSQVLASGAGESFAVTWSGLGSRPKCIGTRTRIGPGRYSLEGRLGSLRSPRAPLALR